jgi:hypothetical protein
MQRLTVQSEGEWSFDPDPEGEVVNADDAIEVIKALASALKWVAESVSRENDEFGMWAAVDAAITKAESTGHL